jgi:hypothetical protein
MKPAIDKLASNRAAARAILGGTGTATQRMKVIARGIEAGRVDAAAAGFSHVNAKCRDSISR